MPKRFKEAVLTDEPIKIDDVIILKPKNARELRENLIELGILPIIATEMARNMAKDIRSDDFLRGYAPLMFIGDKMVKVIPEIARVLP